MDNNQAVKKVGIELSNGEVRKGMAMLGVYVDLQGNMKVVADNVEVLGEHGMLRTQKVINNLIDSTVNSSIMNSIEIVSGQDITKQQQVSQEELEKTKGDSSKEVAELKMEEIENK